MFFRANVLSGKAHFRNIHAFNRFIESLEGKEIRVEVEEYDLHSHNQRKWFHWTCGWIAKHCPGYSLEDVKIVAKSFLPPVVDNVGNLELRPTRRLTKEEYSFLIDQLIQFAAEKLELVVPDPRKPK